MVDKSTQVPESTREGGREAAEQPTSGSSGASATLAGSRSGAASVAANLLDIRTRLALHGEVLAALCERFGDPELATMIRKGRQQGFRRGR